MSKYAGMVAIGFISVQLLLAGCSSTDSTYTDYGKPVHDTRMVITEKGLKWDIDKTAPSFEETIADFPFEVKQIKLPFPPTSTAASPIEAPFDMIQLTYANLEMGRQLILVESNPEDDSTLNGKTGPQLKNGEKTYIQSDSHSSALSWRHDGLTYLLISNKVKNQQFVPLYSPDELVKVADTIQ
ncbi:hypothetical protein GRF59_05310 [Paenibacillus sp. HJL G12]|uniref:DUF4367 domain-containing protein n=1 Tax=Paenibacillus dendrobii TaxID=2691084 RepID=A0A7X3LEY8_9BACL|nr:hypothetical protein [Paenibacillus dendrobii]MWV43041.1 hypothetical protein [Paenibacillus dendrobii]